MIFSEKIYLVIEGASIANKLEFIFSRSRQLKYLREDENPIPALLKGNVACVIVVLLGDSEATWKRIVEICSGFNYLPVVSVVPDKSNIDLICELGRAGVSKVITLGNLACINEIINEITQVKHLKIRLSDLDISIKSSSLIVEESLKIIERDYQVLFSVQEISDRIGINECTLSREFRKANVMSPKRLLMLFKVRHAILLMTHPRFNINEIASISGFTNAKRFIECFKRVYECSPSEYRKNLNKVNN